ncbi:hypothetical protein H8N03_25815 [Ramlibacter sp. USB13]|uniref:Uncharacterized protein n=1 Tax=Ramlibacter cellulosilyticus TaxID=2764187 RepID=A0A923MWK1_9BURK|nr:hypothetical protein [Ramlibacter cellulosilyticus]MBC5786381.1 hypothetical protein [Ramlibacter cellulosilyticus]
MNLHDHMHRFRLASRELFNQFFRLDDPYPDNRGWVLEERYREVENLLFQKLVIEPTGLDGVEYGTLNHGIRVALRNGEFAPIMLNREIDSGYWDYPLEEVTREAKLGFISFFDWDQLDYRDHRYVRVQVLEWAAQPAVVGKHGFIETHYARFHEA